MAREWRNSCGQCGAAELLMVRKRGWFYVAIIFHDNGATIQPHASNGYICISETIGALLTPDKLDFENTPILESNYLVAPRSMIGSQQSIEMFPLEMVQRFGALLCAPGNFYQMKGLAESFPLPTIPDEATVMAMTKDEETGLYPEADTEVGLTDTKDEYKQWHRATEINDRPVRGTVISAINLFPDWPKRGADYYCGLRVEAYQNFVKNQKMFCEAMNTFFGVSDCF